MDRSFGYNRMSREEDFLGRDELVHSFVDLVSKHGNLLLNVGPRGEDAAIPEPQLRRLEWLGEFLAGSGEAIYDTRPWWRAEGTSGEGLPVRFTARGDTVYALVLGQPRGARLTLRGLRPRPSARVELLGQGPLAWRREGEDLHLDLPVLAERPVHTLALRGY